MLRLFRQAAQCVSLRALAGVVLCSCGGRMELAPVDGAEDTPEAKDASLTIDQFLPELTAAVCENLRECCAFVGKRPSDACKAHVDTIWSPLVSAASARGARFDGSHARLCVEAHRRAWIRCKDRKVETYRLDEACLGVFDDPAAVALPGEPCSFSMDCKDSLATRTVCVLTSDHRSYCERRVTADSGAPCGRSPDGFQIADCKDGWICTANDSWSSDAICRTRGSKGLWSCASRASDFCDVGLECDEFHDRCLEATPFGSRCDEQTNCEQFCDGSGYCRPRPDLLTALFCQ